MGVDQNKSKINHEKAMKLKKKRQTGGRKKQFSGEFVMLDIGVIS